MWCHPRAELPGNPRGRSPAGGVSRLTFALPDPRAPPLSGDLGSQEAKPEGSRPSGEGRPRDTREGGGERARRERSRDSPPFPQVPGAPARKARYPFALSLSFDLFRRLSAGLLSTTCASLFNAGLTVDGRRIQRELSI